MRLVANANTGCKRHQNGVQRRVRPDASAWISAHGAMCSGVIVQRTQNVLRALVVSGFRDPSICANSCSPCAPALPVKQAGSAVGFPAFLLFGVRVSGSCGPGSATPAPLSRGSSNPVRAVASLAPLMVRKSFRCAGRCCPQSRRRTGPGPHRAQALPWPANTAGQMPYVQRLHGHFGVRCGLGQVNAPALRQCRQ